MFDKYTYTYVLVGKLPSVYAITATLYYQGKQIDFYTFSLTLTTPVNFSLGPLPSPAYLIYPLACLVTALLYVSSSEEYDPKVAHERRRMVNWGVAAVFVGVVFDYFVISNSALKDIGLVMASLAFFSALGLISRFRGNRRLGSLFASILVLMLFLPFVIDELVVSEIPSLNTISEFITEVAIVCFTAVAGAVLDFLLGRDRGPGRTQT